MNARENPVPSGDEPIEDLIASMRPRHECQGEPRNYSFYSTIDVALQ